MKTQSRAEFLREYHGNYDRLSSTMLRTLAKQPQAFHDLYVAQSRKPDEPSMQMYRSSVIHAMALEHQTARTIVGVYPKYNPDLAKLKSLTAKQRDGLSVPAASKFAKLCGLTRSDFEAMPIGELQQIAKPICVQPVKSNDAVNEPAATEWRKQHPEYMYWLTRSQYDQMRESAAVLMQTGLYCSIVDHPETEIEVHIEWEDETSGLGCRALIDFLRIVDDVAWVWDLKITPLATDFSKFFQSQKSWVQMEHYRRAVKAKYGVRDVRYSYLAHEPEYPYTTTVNSLWTGPGHTLDVDGIEALAAIESAYDELLEVLQRRTEWDDWQPRTATHVNPIELGYRQRTLQIA